MKTVTGLTLAQSAPSSSDILVDVLMQSLWRTTRGRWSTKGPVWAERVVRGAFGARGGWALSAESCGRDSRTPMSRIAQRLAGRVYGGLAAGFNVDDMQVRSPSRALAAITERGAAVGAFARPSAGHSR